MIISRSIHVAANGIISFFLWLSKIPLGFPGGSAVKNLPANAGDMGLILELGRSFGEENGNPL